MTELNQILHADCMDVMQDIPDKYFELAIVDPPYGLDINTSGRLVKEKGLKYKDWDKTIPSPLYFKELSRISQNQIIWGGNYFTLPATRGFIIWDKQQPEGVSFASCEFAWSSFDRSAKTFYQRPQGEKQFHPTQKPVQLYKWLLKTYAKQGDKILDTHSGSGSLAVACIDMGFQYLAIEKDKDYYNASIKRIEKENIKLKLAI